MWFLVETSRRLLAFELVAITFEERRSMAKIDRLDELGHAVLHGRIDGLESGEARTLDVPAVIVPEASRWA